MTAYKTVMLAVLCAGFGALASCGNDGEPTATTATSGGGGGGSVSLCGLIGQPLAEATAPVERGDMSFAVHAECGRVFMFHGDHAVPVDCGPAASEFMDDAYVFDIGANVWSQLTVAGPAPIARARARGVWDAARERAIIFGGRHRAGDVGDYDFYNDVWTFDPATMSWTELSPNLAPGAPTGRMNFTFDYDAAGDRVIVHGGGTTDFTDFIIDNQTWAFDLATNSWSQIGLGTPPPARIFHMATFDQAGRRLIIFGGGGADAFTATSFMRDTWVLDIATDAWSQVQSALSPEGRIKGEMVFDDARSRAVLFGGHDDQALGNNNDIWLLDMASLAWSRQPGGDVFNKPADGFCDFPSDFAIVDAAFPERRESHLFGAAGGVAIMYGGRTDCGLAKDTWSLDLATLGWTQLNPSPLGMTCFRSGSLSCQEPGARLCI
jgi:N-acetylneuraminic acid mutarotase